MLRGGSWNNNPRNCRAANRNRNNPDNRNNNNGLRVVVVSGGSAGSLEIFRTGMSAITVTGSVSRESEPGSCSCPCTHGRGECMLYPRPAHAVIAPGGG